LKPGHSPQNIKCIGRGVFVEAHGSVEALKKAIAEDYSKKIREINSHKAAQVKEIRANAKLETALVQKSLKQEIESRVSEARAMVLNEQKLSAKRAFEESREAMVQEILSDARKAFPKSLKGTQYKSFVKKNSPGKAVVNGSPFFKSQFKGLKPEPGLNGVRFVKGSVIYDLGLDALLEAKQSTVREKIISTLW